MAESDTAADAPSAAAMALSPTAEVSEVAAVSITGASGGAGAKIAKLRDANAKYKSLLKMAKERIQSQEEELEKLRADLLRANEEIATEKKNADLNGNVPNGLATEGGASESVENSSTIVRVCQRIKCEVDDDGGVMMGNEDDALGSSQNREDGRGECGDDASYEVWALIEYEPLSNPDLPEPIAPCPSKRYKKWRRFGGESALADFIRRDTGEPVTLPPYSLSPEQSKRIEEESRRAVSHVTEEFRRFRVRSEVARKQADATVRALHSSNVQTTKRRIEGQDLEKELEQARTDHAQLASLRSEMAEQEAQWKEAYDVLLSENNALRSSGAEALLAAQWRQRYESCLAEKEDAEAKLKMAKAKVDAAAEQRQKADSGKYEMKYRDLKESFRLYRKKAKEIFEAQQRGDVSLLNLSEKGTEDAKIAYLRNLMVNYLSSDSAVREHMEIAIGTVLKFSAEDKAKIEKKKEGGSDANAWFKS